jgi:uncharacterized membrane protein YdbT with pleckstrin-like domain
MGHYLEKSLQGDEKVIYSAELHWIVYHIGATITLIGALFGKYAPKLMHLYLGQKIADIAAKPVSYIAIGIIVVGALHLFFGFIRQISTELIITNHRVIAKYGFISVTTYELMLYKVEGANIEQSITGRLLGYGTVMVKGTGGGISPIDHVANPYKFHACLMQVLETANRQSASQGGPGNHLHD